MLSHLVGTLHVLSLLSRKAGRGERHSLAVPSLSCGPELLDHVRQVGLGLGAKGRSLGPKLSELLVLTMRNVNHEGLSMSSELDELGLDGRNGRLGSLNGGLRGRLGGKNLRVQSGALCLQCSDFIGQGQ